MKELDLYLFPACHLIIILLHRVPELQTIQVLLLYVFLVYVDESDLERQACPLVIIEHFQNIIDVVYYSSRQYLALVEDLRELHDSVPWG